MVDTGTVPRVHRTPLTPLSNYYSERRQKENQLFVVVCRGRCRAPEFEVASAEEPVSFIIARRPTTSGGTDVWAVTPVGQQWPLHLLLG